MWSSRGRVRTTPELPHVHENAKIAFSHNSSLINFIFSTKNKQLISSKKNVLKTRPQKFLVINELIQFIKRVRTSCAGFWENSVLSNMI